MLRSVLLVFAIAAGLSAPAVVDRLQPDFICWETDMEFPVDCDDEE
jgi:hypothetical protein